VDLLRPVIRPYAWGSRYGIATLQGRPVPAEGPEAELWMGAHPSAPSGLDRDGRPATLDAVIAVGPGRELGPDCVARFGARLPFLLKVLSADRALSIQVHPSRAQAKAGFRAENERGLAPDDPARNYIDDWPKPELLCALTPFEVLAGLRTPADAAGILRALAVDQLQPLVAGLEQGTSDLGGVLESVLRWPEGGRKELVNQVVAACERLASVDGPYAGTCTAALRVALEHPGDLGLVALLLMRHTVLEPGEAVFMPAGGLHAYLRGTGIELLANSDNVVRAGLTGKHIDVPELLRLVDPSAAVPVLSPRVLPGGIACFDTPAPEFGLCLLELSGPALALPGPGPRILLGLSGRAHLRSSAGQELELNRGESCFIPFADGPVHATGHAHLALATPRPVPQAPRFAGRGPAVGGGRGR
jgi:mannose-6-phosphate isomerase